MSFRVILAVIFTALTSTAALACPNTRLYGDTYYLSGSDLYNPQSVKVVAGGDEQIGYCNIRFGSDKGTGYVTVEPDFSIELSGMKNYSLEISVVSECDAILLINTGTENWYYDDDDNGNYDPKISLNPSVEWMA